MRVTHCRTSSLLLIFVVIRQEEMSPLLDVYCCTFIEKTRAQCKCSISLRYFPFAFHQVFPLPIFSSRGRYRKGFVDTKMRSNRKEEKTTFSAKRSLALTFQLLIVVKSIKLVVV